MTNVELRALLAAATAGEWVARPCDQGGVILLRGPGEGAPRAERHAQSHLQIIPAVEGTLIAALHNAAPRLLAESEALEKLRALRNELETLATDTGAPSYAGLAERALALLAKGTKT